MTQKIWRVCSYLLGMGMIISPQSLTLAQLIPDNTLGSESSLIHKINELSDRLMGGQLAELISFTVWLSRTCDDKKILLDVFTNVRCTRNDLPSHDRTLTPSASLFLLFC